MPQTITREAVEAMSSSELLRTYNELTGESVRKFSTKAVGIKRTLQALAKREVDAANSRAIAKADQENARVRDERAGSKDGMTQSERAMTSSGVSKARRKRLDLPARSAIKPHRDGTNRAKLIQLLHSGATIEQCMVATGWNYQNTYEGIRILHTYLGYGIKENDQGIIRLVV